VSPKLTSAPTKKREANGKKDHTQKPVKKAQSADKKKAPAKPETEIEKTTNDTTSKNEKLKKSEARSI